MPTPPWLTKLYRPESVPLAGHTVLTNIGTAYQVIGQAEVDLTAVAQITFRAVANKVGSGTQSWQLWNATDGVELAVFDDVASAGLHTFGPAVIDVSALTGIKLLQLRGKSTTAADDPVFRGASLLLE